MPYALFVKLHCTLVQHRRHLRVDSFARCDKNYFTLSVKIEFVQHCRSLFTNFSRFDDKVQRTPGLSSRSKGSGLNATNLMPVNRLWNGEIL
jgi:hypothetical protein